MTPIIATTGNENQNEGQAKVNLFWCPSRGQAGIEQFMGKAADRGHPSGITKLGAQAPIPAVVGSDPKIKGRWRTTTYNVPDGTILKAFGFVKPPNFGSRKRNASVFLRVREQGPMTRIVVPLLCGPRSALREAEITGRFDIITPEQAIPLLSYEVKEHFLQFFDESNIRKVFNIVELEPERVALPSIRETKIVDRNTGETRVIKEKVRKRKLKF